MAHWAAALRGCAGDAEIHERYKRLAKTAHPDLGGSHQAMMCLNRARDAALKEREEAEAAAKAPRSAPAAPLGDRAAKKAAAPPRAQGHHVTGFSGGGFGNPVIDHVLPRLYCCNYHVLQRHLPRLGCIIF